MGQVSRDTYNCYKDQSGCDGAFSVDAYRLHKQVEVLLSALVNREVVTREKLLEVWKADPKCKGFTAVLFVLLCITWRFAFPADLLKAYSMWLPESKHKSLTEIWPPLDYR